MDNVEAVKDLEKHFHNMRSDLVYVDDPKFFQFPNHIKLYKGDTLVIEVCSNVCYAAVKSEIVKISILDKCFFLCDHKGS
jgi:plexin A